MFWDRFVRRLVLGFAVLPEGLNQVSELLNRAYQPNLFWVHPGLHLGPTLSARSLGFVRLACRPGTLLHGEAHRAQAHELTPADLQEALEAHLPRRSPVPVPGPSSPRQLWEAYFEALQAVHVPRVVRFVSRLQHVCEEEPALSDLVLRDFGGLAVAVRAGEVDHAAVPEESVRVLADAFFHNGHGPAHGPGLVMPAWLSDQGERDFLWSCCVTLDASERVAVYLLLYAELDLLQTFRVLDGLTAARPAWAISGPAPTARSAHLTARLQLVLQVVHQAGRARVGGN